MLTEYDTDQALTTFRCGGIDPHLFLVSRWQGTEGVSQLYRFEVELASADADIDLEKVLGSRATLSLRTDVGDILPWHGIVTELRQTRRDETYAYYRAVLEPQIALLRLFRQSRVYLHADGQSGGKPDLASVIRMVLEQAGLTQEGDSGDTQTPHYEIRVPDSDLAGTQTSFICQFEETSLDFLMRRLEHAGVYFWFEQAHGREVVVFGNDRDQQPDHDISMAWRPEGDLNPESGVVAVSRFDHAVSVQPKGVVLRDFSVSQPSLDLTVKADVSPDEQGSSDRFDTVGSIEVYGSHYKKQDHGEQMATIRAEEIACQRNRYFGEARSAGLRAWYLFAMDEHFRDSLNARYYVIQIEHEGQQSLPRQTAEQGDEERSYHAHFTVLPAALQYRPARTTRKPRVVGFLSAIVMAEGDGQYAQMNEYGCYRIQFLFAPPGSGGQDDANSAWVRMATPYAGSQHGMNFPLLKGTEVLVSFLGGDPDRPVIMAAIPNEENPSIRNQDNATQPGLRTAGQNALEFEDKQGQEHARLSSPAGNTTIQLGTDAKNADQSGVRVATTAHMGTTSSSYVQQVPGVYHQEIGCEGKVALDPEPKMAFQAAWDAQKAKRLEAQALLPNAPEAVQLKALDAKLAAKKAAAGLLSHRLQAAQKSGLLSDSALTALMAEHAAAQESLDAAEAVLESEQNKEGSPGAILQLLINSEQNKKEEQSAQNSEPESNDEETLSGEENKPDDKPKKESPAKEHVGQGPVPTLTTTCLAVKSDLSAGMVSDVIGGNYNMAVAGLATSINLIGVSDIFAGFALNLALGKAKTFTLSGEEFGTTSSLKKSVREEATSVEKKRKTLKTQLDANTKHEYVRVDYHIDVDGAYTVKGGITKPEIKFSTGESALSIKHDRQISSSKHFEFLGQSGETKIVINDVSGDIDIKARHKVKIKEAEGLELRARVNADIVANIVRLNYAGIP